MGNILLAVALKIDADELGIPVITDTNSVLDNIINGVYMVIAALAVFFIIRGALLYITHGSNAAENKKARDTILYSVVALAGSTLVFALIQLIIGAL